MSSPLKAFARAMRHNPTPAEQRLWQALRSRQCHGLKFRRQQPLGTYILDFYCDHARLVVEVDGETHADAAQDATRDRWLAAHGLRILRLTNRDVMTNPEGSLTRIAEYAQALRPAEEEGPKRKPYPSGTKSGDGLKPNPKPK